MKKTLLLLICIIYVSSALNAQSTARITRDASNKFNFLTIDGVNYSTLFQYTDTGSVEYTGTGYRAGVLEGTFAICYLAKNKPTDYDSPQSASMDFSVVNMYQDTTSYESINLKEYMDEIKISERNIIGESKQIDLFRGGRYAVAISSDTLGYEYRDTIDVLDNPSLRVRCYPQVVGHDLDVYGRFNTGYPYNLNSYTGNESVRDSLYYVVNDSTFRPVYSYAKRLSLKNASKPLIAGIDTIEFTIKKPEAGRYRLSVHSDVPDGYGHKSFYIDINDTLRATATLNKSSYVLGQDKKATIHLSLDYKYPHIKSTKEYPIPTIVVADKLLDREDTLLFANDSLATKDLSFATDIDIPIDTISAATLSANDNTLQIGLSVLFEGGLKYRAILPLTISNTVGIQNMPAEDVRKNHETYQINGTKYNSKAEELRRGLYIIDGKKYLKK